MRKRKSAKIGSAEGKGAKMERYGKSDKHHPATALMAIFCSAHSLLVQGPHLRRITLVCVVHTDTLFMVVIIAGVLVILYRTPPITPLPIQKGQLFIDAP